MPAAGRPETHHRIPEIQRHHKDAAVRHQLRHRSRRRRRLVEAPHPLRQLRHCLKFCSPPSATPTRAFPCPNGTRAYWAEAAAFLAKNPETSKLYLIDGHAPALGEVFRNPDLAHSLTLIADGGRDAYYKGQIAEKIVAFSKKEGGTMSTRGPRRFLRRMG